jgi:hypothetical protein
MKRPCLEWPLFVERGISKTAIARANQLWLFVADDIRELR